MCCQPVPMVPDTAGTVVLDMSAWRLAGNDGAVPMFPAGRTFEVTAGTAMVTQHTYSPYCDGFHPPGACKL